MHEPTDREVLFNAYVDGDLSDEEAADFDRRLDEDPEFRRAYEEFAAFVDQVRSLPRLQAPDGFADRVKERIHTRSAGRFFGPDILRARTTPYELAAAAMILIMSSAYILMGIPADRGIGSAGQKRLEIPPKSAPAHPQTRR